MRRNKMEELKSKPGFFHFVNHVSFQDIIDELSYEGMTFENVTNIERLPNNEFKVSFEMVC